LTSGWLAQFAAHTMKTYVRAIGARAGFCGVRAYFVAILVLGLFGRFVGAAFCRPFPDHRKTRALLGTMDAPNQPNAKRARY
jgi:hypothetical protein